MGSRFPVIITLLDNHIIGFKSIKLMGLFPPFEKEARMGDANGYRLVPVNVSKFMLAICRRTSL